MNSAIQSISGRALPLSGNDIDTDRIIPARFLLCVTFDGLGEAAFLDDRKGAAGKHPFDLPQYQGASILVVNRNFGCGSSREHAPQALLRWGIKAVIGESFAEIFAGNCLALGMPCLTMGAGQIELLQELLAMNPSALMTLDIASGRVSILDFKATANMDAGVRHQFVSGEWDALGQLLSLHKEVENKAAQLPYLQQFKA